MGAPTKAALDQKAPTVGGQSALADLGGLRGLARVGKCWRSRCGIDAVLRLTYMAQIY